LGLDLGKKTICTVEQALFAANPIKKCPFDGTYFLRLSLAIEKWRLLLDL
jgi:hypothetical protein